ncbi:hypothetical protein P8891_06100 [Bacillus atrophaeus]|uniref:hypothetical protein n=1 Tax=Bacillus atrophaeus TaxID=1452 RepID=UPI00227F7921|nr:hypothetical protein [Bacillus atrophaeus]MCY7948049.1 hypothetical protein [Bacillus atrophaeus]MCY8098006.1 hypothetical protein [Bacillus atrophaeus]MCY9169930.1 hypothetical protein [Bacillus atrophaeus]MEC0740655.1 hypothetical protein [Bacillus atrophaeus]MEC0747081.1 hypothetical protein [Bacillus atrophaeus]
MKEVILELQDLSGNVIEEKTLRISSKDKLVFTYDDRMSQSDAHMIFTRLIESLSDDSVKAVGIPSSIKVEVLKIED